MRSRLFINLAQRVTCVSSPNNPSFALLNKNFSNLSSGQKKIVTSLPSLLSQRPNQLIMSQKSILSFFAKKPASTTASAASGESSDKKEKSEKVKEEKENKAAKSNKIESKNKQVLKTPNSNSKQKRKKSDSQAQVQESPPCKKLSKKQKKSPEKNKKQEAEKSADDTSEIKESPVKTQQRKKKSRTISSSSEEETPVPRKSRTRRAIASSSEDDDTEEVKKESPVKKKASPKAVASPTKTKVSSPPQKKKVSQKKSNHKAEGVKAKLQQFAYAPKVAYSYSDDEQSDHQHQEAAVSKVEEETKNDGPKVKEEKEDEDNMEIEEKSSDDDDGQKKEKNEKEENVKEEEEEEMEIEEEKEEEEKKPEPKKKNIPSMFFGGSAKAKSEKKATETTAYDPGAKSYDPVGDACWKRGEKVPYRALAETFRLIEDTSGRLRIVEILRNFLRSVIALNPDQLVTCVYLSLNQLAPAYMGIELGIGDRILQKSICESTGRKLSMVREDMKKLGDLGLVAEKCKSGQRLLVVPAPLTVDGVFGKMKQIANTSGGSTQNLKVQLINGMMKACTGCEPRYLIRSLSGKLRIGLAEQSVLMALANAVVMTPPGQKEFPPKVLNSLRGKSAESAKAILDEKALLLKMCYCEMPNYDVMIKTIMEHGIDNLADHCKLTPGIPLKPMLAHPTKGVSQVLDRFHDSHFTCEYKYDGERAQIHLLPDGQVHIYSRNQENNTSKYPDIIERVPQVLKEGVKSFVIDSEAVAWDTEKKQILPFQVLTTRKRKDASSSEIKVQVCIYAFDLLYFNGQSLVREPLRKRRELLRDNFRELDGKFVFATAQDTTDVDEIAKLLDESVQGNCEGLMVKTLDKEATYEIAKRSHNWLKLKKDYLEGVGDTLDLVVIGAMKGKGKRAGTYGNYLLACYDEESEEYQAICKIGTGFSDQDLVEQSNFFKEHIIDQPKSYYRLNGTTADDWFEPCRVWEVKAADLSISPVYAAAAGIVDPEKGISLRFPRLVRVRDDKKPEMATSSRQVADMYEKQQQIVNKNKASDKSNNFDFY